MALEYRSTTDLIADAFRAAHPDAGQRVAEALRLASGGWASMVSLGIWVVRSESGRRTYPVVLDRDDCTCQDARYRRRVCKHVLAARAAAQMHAVRERAFAERLHGAEVHDRIVPASAACASCGRDNVVPRGHELCASCEYDALYPAK